MGYKEAYEKASEQGSIKELTAEYKEWKKEGDLLVGKFISTNKVKSRLGSGEYSQYLFETDDGLVKFALGAITDAEALPLMESGRIYAIEYRGKEKIAGGRQVNLFKIIEVSPPEGSDGDTGDKVPF